MLDGRLALRPVADGILCEVIGRETNDLRHYKVAIESAQSLLETSALFSATVGKRLFWLVVEDYGTGTTELWCAS